MTCDSRIEPVDISALFGPVASPGIAECDAAIWAGLRRSGAIVIHGYPDADQVDRRARRGLEVFTFPRAERRALTTRLIEPENPNTYRGYWPCTPDRLLQNDFFDVGPAQPAPGPDLPGMEIFAEPTPWPTARPGWARDVRAHYDHLNAIAQALIRSVGRSAGFDAAMIGARFDGAHSTLRYLSYAPGAGLDAGFSAARHTDASGLSLLWQDQPGLEAQGQDGVWRAIPMRPDTLSVHVGDVMTGLTAGAVPATPHRVRASDRPRRSVGFFLEPALSAPVTPADHDGGPDVRDSYGWQLLRTFAARPHWQGVIRDPET
ncbi:MAG: hypothetical protein OIF47_00330 [Marinibacterium sp.]|nr:hypothetical protein [Marinibacterium sp.]